MVIVGVALTLTVQSCSDDDESYPESVRINFMSACMATGGIGASSECACAFDAIEDEFALDEYILFEAEFIATGRMSPQIIAVMLRGCSAGETGTDLGEWFRNYWVLVVIGAISVTGLVGGVWDMYSARQSKP